jgi:ubiquinone/menaquinone biosynthesis C-methylase UbiE
MTHWDSFFREKILAITQAHRRIIDIGGGLRISKEKSNRFDPNRAWILDHIKEYEYVIMDPVPDFNPDIVGDIHHMPFADNSEEAIVCIAVLEHVENPIKAVGEVHRVLRTGGSALFYVPFLFYYHAEVGYYKDYWRFSHDAIGLLFRDFATVEIVKVRGALETWIHLSPFGRIALCKHGARLLDRLTGKSKSNQVSGYYIYVRK